jgi:hypothetical protein
MLPLFLRFILLDFRIVRTIWNFELFNFMVFNCRCWMSLMAFYYAFIIPVGIIILSNIVIFIMILKNLLGRPKGLQSNQSDRKRAMLNLRAAFSVFVLLGKINYT